MRTTMSKTACIIAAANPARHHAGPAYPEILVSLTKDQVQHIATLARLKLAAQEFDDVVSKLSRIVDFVDQLQAAPTENVLPMAHPMDQVQRLRPDRVTETDERETIQVNAAAVRDGYYLVPKVLE
jgi:aspartyl-tRNA(Asn)/glutamyl-tRNA(Gln) amidotransferase subunit C